MVTFFDFGLAGDFYRYCSVSVAPHTSSHQGCQSRPCIPDWRGLTPGTSWRTGKCHPAFSAPLPPSGLVSQMLAPLLMIRVKLFIVIILIDFGFY